MSATFRAQDYAWSQVPGKNAIEGQAFMRTVGGDVKTCAGLRVSLVPAGAYSNERILTLYGSNESGSNLYPSPRSETFEPDDPGYKAVARSTICGADGRFSFNQVPDGDFYVTAEVTWSSAGQYGLTTQGGWIMRRVHITGGQTVSIALAA